MSRVSFEDVLKAHERIVSHIHKTPVFTSSSVDKIAGRKVYFKAECLQKTGSFKARGALNAILALKDTGNSSAGVVTHSSGNHGQAVAWASRLAGLPCSVIVPQDTTAVKQDAIKGYGANLILCESSPTSRVETCNKVAKETGQVIIPPYDKYEVIAGQGTIAVELLTQVPDLDAIIVPISGGGLISGIATAAKEIKPNIRVYAVEPVGKDLEHCLREGKRLWPNPPTFLDTIADGIKTQQVGQLTWPIVLSLVEKDVFTVSDEQIKDAMKFAFQRLKLVIEAAAGAAMAAVISQKMKQLDPAIAKVGVILCGGNVDICNLPWK
ncbi:serine racemase-like [Liolophura sinensis]|uniref:serine racemase-like n=1 Tax=Liolophura sinensis TaxID=3198878 RepID=UPI0031598B20